MLYSVTYSYEDFIDGEDTTCRGDGGTYVSYDVACAVVHTLTELGYRSEVYSFEPQGTDYS